MEILGYVTFFWALLLSPRFRAAQVQEWREGSLLERLWLVYEAVVSLVFGLAVPIVLLGWVAGRIH